MANKTIEKMLQGLNILVVDDNAYMRRLTRMMLTNLGAKSVLEAPDGLAALEAIRTADPDVMLLDWDMPVLNGIEVLRIVRSFPRPNLPVIMLTTRAKRSYVNEALRAGANEFLLKPTSPKALCDRLMSIVFKPRPMVKVGTFTCRSRGVQQRHARPRKPAETNLGDRGTRRWRARDDSNVRPLPSEGNALSS
jgi:two-component system, chemotaxis family, chemotaxis protein CheY